MTDRGLYSFTDAEKAFEEQLKSRRLECPVSFRDVWTEVRSRAEAGQTRKAAWGRFLGKIAGAASVLSAAAATVAIVITGLTGPVKSQTVMTMIRGGVLTGTPSASSRPCALKETLSRGAVLSTKRGGECELQVAQNALIDLSESSEIVLLALPHDNPRGETVVRLNKGRITFRSFSYRMDRKFTVITEQAVIDATGSRSTVVVTPEGDVRVAVQEGSVKVEPALSAPSSLARKIRNLPADQKETLREITAPTLVSGGKSATVRQSAVRVLRERLADATGETGLSTDGVMSPVQTDLIPKQDGEKLLAMADTALIVRPYSGALAKVGFRSRPEHVIVTVRRQTAGTTPFDRLLEADAPLSVTASRNGYQTLRTNILLKNDRDILLELSPSPVTDAKTPVPDQRNGPADSLLPDRILRSRGVPYEDALLVSDQNTLRIYRSDRLTGRIAVVPENSKLTKPLLVRDRVILGSDSGGLFAYSVDGRLIWSRKDAGRASPSAAPMAGGNMIFLPTSDKGIEVYSRDGNPLREIVFESGGGILTTPYYDAAGKVLVFRNGLDRFVAYDMGYHNVLWSSSEGRRKTVSAMTGNGEAVFAFFRDTGEIVAFNQVTGSVLWKKTVPSLRGTDLTAYADSSWIYVTVETDSVTLFLALSAGTGWQEFRKDWTGSSRPQISWDGYRIQAVADGVRSDYDPVVRSFVTED